MLRAWPTEPCGICGTFTVCPACNGLRYSGPSEEYAAEQHAAEQHAACEVEFGRSSETEALRDANRANAISSFVIGCKWKAMQGTGLRYSGPLPDGYEFHVVTAERGYVSLKTRARRTDGTWNGPWRQQKQGGLVVGDAWKHATGATDADVDEAGAG